MSKGGAPAGWREPILAHFTPEIAAVARLTIVRDPDQLIADQRVLDGIRKQGFELIPFEDHVAFRYAFESLYRQSWDRGEDTKLVVVLRAGGPDVSALPFDLLEHARQSSRVLSFSIGELFPRLDPRIVGELDPTDLDLLYQAQASNKGGTLGENETKDFILERVFGVIVENIRTPADLLGALLQRHYRRRSFPPRLDNRFIQLLRKNGLWNDWPLDEIVPDQSRFLGFLQERWPIFVRRKLSNSGGAAESETPYGLRFGGPPDLPFDHETIRVYIDNLFVEGHLAPTDVVSKTAVDDPWMALGVRGDFKEDELERFQRLIERIESDLPADDANHAEWLVFAALWAEAIALRWRVQSTAAEELTASFDQLHDRIEHRFAEWMLAHFGSLYTGSFVRDPVMVHQIPHYLAHSFVPSGHADAKQKYAVIVVDGLALDQWVVLREDLETNARISINEAAVFAWVPTLTSVSRQAIFFGDAPRFFPATISGTQKEEHHWRRFWEDRGARRNEIAYVCQKKNEDEDVFMQRVQEGAEHPKRRILGVVVGTIDATMHGQRMGTGGMHVDVRHWAEKGHFRELISLLHDNGFEVYVTSDHGNIEAFGTGKPNVHDIADERGERVYVFRNDLTRAAVQAEYPETIIWPQVGLPENYRALLARQRHAFTHQGTRAVTHGGISIEEVIVPFVRLGEAQ